MKIAYIISAYKLPDQLVRLVNRLNKNNSTFFIHVDKKTEFDILNRMVKPLVLEPNVHFLKRHVCNWGDFGHVKATLKGFTEALKQDVPFDYYFVLTGQDYPIKSNNQIQEFLQLNCGSSFISFFSSPHRLANEWKKRISFWHLRIGKYAFSFPGQQQFNNSIVQYCWNQIVLKIKSRRKLPYGFRPYFGSSYFCLTNECVKYIMEFLKNKKRYKRFFYHVYIPDEMFFQTILLNSPLRNNIINNDLIFKKFITPKAHPEILMKEDFDNFIHSKNLFARKFDLSIDNEVLDLIDRKII